MKKVPIICFLIFQMVSCQNRSVKITPDEFISKENAPKDLYRNDSIQLVALIKKEIQEKNGAYMANFYDSLTIVSIDTIMYNKKLNRMVFFIIDKIENKKLYPKNWNKDNVEHLEKYGNLPYEGYHYNAKAYIGIRNGDSLKIYNYFRLNIDDYTNVDILRKRQRQMFFEEFSAVDEEGYEYNINDARFWDNPHVWDNIKN